MPEDKVVKQDEQRGRKRGEAEQLGDAQTVGQVQAVGAQALDEAAPNPYQATYMRKTCPL
jgi:hypothetical protein